MDLLDLAAAMLVASAVAGVANHMWFRIPHTISLVLFSLVTCLGITAADWMMPGVPLADTVSAAVAAIDFRAVVMDGMLGFMLFAGAMHVDMDELAKRKWTIGVMATVGVVVSTLAVGFLTWIAWGLVGIEVPLIVCIAFGALISPTDPVAVLAIFKTVKVPRALEAKIAGESLFNDGVAVVVFAAALAAAAPYMGPASAHVAEPTAASIATLFVRDAFGGAALGVVLGWVACRLMRHVDDHAIEIMVTLALVASVMASARALHVSGPIAVVVAGLIIGSVGKRDSMSENTRQHLGSFWGVLDETFNSVLFLLLGLEAIVIAHQWSNLLAAAIAVPLVLLARLVSVGASLSWLSMGKGKLNRVSVAVLTWGGLRGAVSLALAVSLPDGPYKPMLLSVTFVVVIFSVVVQGLTVKRVVDATVGREAKIVEAEALEEDIAEELEEEAAIERELAERRATARPHARPMF